MAIIHQGRNENREAINSYLDEEVRQVKWNYEKWVEEENRSYREATQNAYEEAKNAYEGAKNACEEAIRAYEAEKRSHRRRIPFRLLIILLCVGLILLLVQHPRIIIQIQRKAEWLFARLSDAVNTDAIVRLAPEIKASGKWEWVAQMANILIQLGLALLAMLCTVMLFLADVSVRFLILVLFYGLPGVVALWHIVMLFIHPKLKMKQFVLQPFNLKFSDVKPVHAEFNEKIEREVIMETMPDEWRILQSGLEGEDEALNLLSGLGNDFHIYTNLVIPYDGKTSETDLVVVAPHGMTIVEVKNYKDTLTGDWSDEHLWLKKKRGRENYTAQVYNPVRQVGTHVYRLSHYLREHGVDAWVNSCVLFVNENIQLHQMTDANNKLQECPVFRYEEEGKLFDYLRTTHPETSGSSVVSLLNKLIAQQTKG